ncbi:MAG: hypothetical protein KIT11_07175 [Fimbriimonadaceae bacterium]|nr:hypothetical protein [Fimbriimonadaceae bacterium]QYK56133.1 MAG: hypothetical protein KF733_01365 [Fimbriimonadaceae bacterium]
MTELDARPYMYTYDVPVAGGNFINRFFPSSHGRIGKVRLRLRINPAQPIQPAYWSVATDQINCVVKGSKL